MLVVAVAHLFCAQALRPVDMRDDEDRYSAVQRPAVHFCPPKIYFVGLIAAPVVLWVVCQVTLQIVCLNQMLHLRAQLRNVQRGDAATAAAGAAAEEEVTATQDGTKTATDPDDSELQATQVSTNTRAGWAQVCELTGLVVVGVLSECVLVDISQPIWTFLVRWRLVWCSLRTIGCSFVRKFDIV